MDMASRAQLPWARRPLWARPRRLQQILIMEAMARRAILVVPTIKAADTGAVRNIPEWDIIPGDPTQHTVATLCRTMRRVTASPVIRVPWSNWTTARCIGASRKVAGGVPFQQFDAGALDIRCGTPKRLFRCTLIRSGGFVS